MTRIYPVPSLVGVLALILLGLNHSVLQAGVLYHATGDGPRQIEKYDAATGTLLGSFGIHALRQPFGLNFGPDGILYVSDRGYGNGTVEKFDAQTGQHLGTVVTGLSDTGPVLVRDNGNILVGIDGIQEYDPTGVLLRTFGFRGLDMEIGPNGLLYVAQHVNRTGQRKTIYGYDLTTGNVVQTLPVPVDFRLTYQPLGLAFDSSGMLYVSQNDPFTSQKILKFNVDTNEYVGVFADLPGTRGISDIDFGPGNHLYGSLTDDEQFVVLNGTTGQLIRTIDNVNEPRQLAFAQRPVPEPTSLVIFGAIGLVGLGYRRKW